MAVNAGFGHVYTSRVQDSVNSGKGVFDPGRIAWEEDENGKVFIDGVRCRVIGNGHTELVPPGPQPLAPRTMRFDFHYDHFDPTTGLADRSSIGATWTHVADDIYDFHFDNPVWYCYANMSPTRTAGGLFNIYTYSKGGTDTFPMNLHSYDIIDSNLSGVTDANHLMNSARKCVNCVLKNTGDIVDASYMLSGGNRPASLTTLNSLDLHSATNITYLLYRDESLTSALDITLSGAVTFCGGAFYNCKKVPSGALALYNSLSSQATPPSIYSMCFGNVGVSAAPDAPIHAEIAQIPTSWGGTMASVHAETVGSNRWEVYDYNFAYKSLRLTLTDQIELNQTASFVWTNNSNYNPNGPANATIRGKVFLVLVNPSDTTKYVMGTQFQGSIRSLDQWNTAINLPVTWSGRLSEMFDWGVHDLSYVKDSNNAIDIYIATADASGSPDVGGDPGGTSTFFFPESGEAYGTSMRGNKITFDTPSAV